MLTWAVRLEENGWMGGSVYTVCSVEQAGIGDTLNRGVFAQARADWKQDSAGIDGRARPHTGARCALVCQAGRETKTIQKMGLSLTSISPRGRKGYGQGRYYDYLPPRSPLIRREPPRPVRPVRWSLLPASPPLFPDSTSPASPSSRRGRGAHSPEHGSRGPRGAKGLAARPYHAL